MKLKYSKQKPNLFQVSIFVIIFLLSPWFWVLVRNYSIVFPLRFEIVRPSDVEIVEQINTFRGEAISGNIQSFFARVLINKITFYSSETIKKYLLSFDFQPLFFYGDPDIAKSTHASGPLYLTLIPLIVVGVFFYVKIGKKILIVLTLLSLVPTAFLKDSFDVVTRMPFFLLLSWLASYGFILLVKKRKIIAFLLVLFFVFEFIRFSHDFYNHYPNRMAQEIYLKITK